VHGGIFRKGAHINSRLFIDLYLSCFKTLCVFHEPFLYHVNQCLTSLSTGRRSQMRYMWKDI